MNILDSFRNLISFRKVSRSGLESAPTASREGAFVTWEALVTFPVSSSIVTVIWKVLQNLDPNSPSMKSLLVPLILSFLLGALFSYVDFTDPQNKDRTPNTTVRKLALAVVNSFFLASAAMGIDAAVLGRTP